MSARMSDNLCAHLADSALIIITVTCSVPRWRENQSLWIRRLGVNALLAHLQLRKLCMKVMKIIDLVSNTW